MSADAPTKPRIDPLPQLYKEAAWAIKWVDPDFYKALTARDGGEEGAKRDSLAEFFRNQSDESRVVLNEMGELNADGEKILQTFKELSKSAPASRPSTGGSGKTVPRVTNKENQEGLAQKFAFMLVYFEDESAVAKVKEVIKEETGASYGTLTTKIFNDMKPDLYSDDDKQQFPDLPSFDLQEKLYKKLVPTKNYTKAIFDTLQATSLGGRAEVFRGLTGASREFRDIPGDERRQFNVDQVARSAITAYRLAHERELPD